MNTAMRTTLTTMMFAVTAAIATPGAANAAPEFDRYRCAVNGDTRYCETPQLPASERVETRLVPGPYALMLMRQGRGEAQAIEAARDAGEWPHLRTERIVERPLSDLERYQRVLGSLQTPERVIETLAETPVDPASGALRAAREIQRPL